MANTVEKAKVYQTYLDQVVQASLTSGDLVANPNNIRFNGGNTVSIATVETTGMLNYDRNGGYTRGSGNLTWKDYVIPYDRAYEFLVDVMDEDESNGVFSAGALLTEFGANDEAPELDCVRYSAIFQAIVDDTTARFGYYTPAAATVVQTFNNDVAKVRKAVGRASPLKAKISETAFSYFTNSTELSKQMVVQEVNGDSVSTEIFKLNGVELMPVPDDRMKTEYALLNTGNGGYSVKDFAQEMNWILYSPQAVIAFEKHRNTKVFAAGTHTDGDGDLIQGRLVHGCFILENKHNMLYVSLKTATITALGATTTTGVTNITYTLGTLYTNRDTGHKFYYITAATVAATTAPACYDDFAVTSYTEITTADAVAKTVTSGYFGALVELDENGRAVKFETLKAA